MSDKTKNTSKKILPFFLFLAILLLGAFFRFYEIRWDENYHLHPDERFLTMVETAISPVSSIKEYFDTSSSSLNPHNIVDVSGNSIFPFFVYGSFPIFLVRYIGEIIGQTGYNEINIVGRYLSGLIDIGTIVLVFMASKEYFRKKWLPFLAALIYACAILPIQISHFFIVDNFATFFSTLAFLFAIKVHVSDEETDATSAKKARWKEVLLNWNGFTYYALFGVAVGLAAASKINAVVIAFLLPMAIILKDEKWLSNFASEKWKIRFRHMFLAGVISIITFRIFQPYAFSGPGFFGLAINPRWINNLRELSYISSGNSSYPPSLQWARRSFWFPIKNLIIWGLGLPAGILAFCGLALIGFRTIKGKHNKYGLIWIFPCVYLIWQAFRWNPTMRYFLIIYPALSIVGAWFLTELNKSIEKVKSKSWKKTALLIGSVILVIGIILGAIAFLNIYRKPMTRITASEWIYENIESAINLSLSDSNGEFIQPLPYPNYLSLRPGYLLNIDFTPEFDGQLSEIIFDHIVNPEVSEAEKNLSVTLYSGINNEILYTQSIYDKFGREGDSRGKEFVIELDSPIDISTGKNYTISVELVDGDNALNFFGNLETRISTDKFVFSQSVFEFTRILVENAGFEAKFSPIRDSQINGIDLYRLLNIENYDLDLRINVEILDNHSGSVKLNQVFDIHPQTKMDYRGKSAQLRFKKPIKLLNNNQYTLKIHFEGNSAALINGSNTVKETDWDDALPLYMHGYNPFDSYEGIYASELNFQMYWDDDKDKLERFLENLYQADYFIITSNRQWGSTTQIPEKFPLTTNFYRELMGCETDDVQWCFRVAQPGMFNGSLGFELVKSFQVNPSILGIQLNSQFAEEAFTVYDHPKVLIFQKTSNFNIQNAAERLTLIDLNQVLNLSIKEAERRPGLLNLVKTQYEKQKSGGTWSDLFSYEAPQNLHPVISVLLWYSCIAFLGIAVYPLTRISFRGLNDKGYPLSKLFGLLLWAFITWILSSNGITFTKLIVIISMAFLGTINLVLLLINKQEIIKEFRQNWRYFISIEIISLILFLFFLLIRIGNPDLWHPYKGGEKPMDFAYFNAIIKSVQFPPYDPWYAGGYINYYYFGFVIAAIPVKLLGIIPSIAYNLILPSFFSFVGTAAFSIGWNLRKCGHGQKVKSNISDETSPYLSGLLTSLFVLIIGNLGTVNMIIQGILKLGASESATPGISSLNKISFFFQGLVKLFQGAKFSFYPGDWYWIPSRVIPGNVITEFPFFSFLYGDPHAHLFSYPLALLSLSWSLSIVLGKIEFKKLMKFLIQIFSGSIIIGCLRPTNTWDYPIYLGIALISLIYTVINDNYFQNHLFPNLNTNLKKVITSIFVAILFTTITFILFIPFDRWYGQAYSSIEIWRGEKSPLWAYLVHWGFYFFIISTWVSKEIYEWARATPLSTLRPVYIHRKKGFILLFVFLTMILGMFLWGVQIVIIAFPLAITTLFLLLQKDNTKEKKFTLFIIIVGISLTLFVEFFALKGDIGRMNTVFKFYLQSWTFLSIGSAYLIPNIFASLNSSIKQNFRKAWKTLFGLLGVSVLCFPLLASLDKITDRISDVTPLSLDGMEFMKYSTYMENGTLMDLNQDYYAIRWMQENVQGTPVIIEANVPEYRWGNRYSIYTGLPSLIGWNWHQRQQRAINPGEWIFGRVDEVTNFYITENPDEVKDIIEKYDVEYIILGQLERAIYPKEGLDKISNLSGILWDPVYSVGDTTIYKVKG